MQKDEVLLRGLDDWVDLSELIWVVQSSTDAGTPADVYELAVELLSELLSDELMVVGTVTETEGFRPWRLSQDEALQRVRRELTQLDRDLLPGEICWRSNTSAGDRRAEHVLQQRTSEDRCLFESEC